MCLVHTPGAPPPPPPPQYLHNPYLDSAAMSPAANRGRNSLVTFGPGAMPAASTSPTQGGPMARSPGLPAPQGGLTLPSMGQPGIVMPSVGGPMAGSMGGRMSPTVPPMGALMRK